MCPLQYAKSKTIWSLKIMFFVLFKVLSKPTLQRQKIIHIHAYLILDKFKISITACRAGSAESSL